MDILGFEKLLYHREKLDKIRDDIPQFPVHVTVSLSNFCNHKCLWCTAYEAQQDKAETFDFDTLIDWLTRARDRGLKAVGYVGNGEPTAYPKFKELVKKVNALGIEQGMFTNGYLLDRYFDEILDYFTYIRISLDAGSAGVHSAMHDVPASHYPKIMANLKEITARRKNAHSPTIGVQYATHHENIHDMENSVRDALEAGVDYFSVKPVFNRGSVGERIEKNRLTTTDTTPLVMDLRKKYQDQNFEIFYRPYQVEAESLNRNVLKYDRCVAGYFNLTLYETGKLIYCGPHQVGVGTIHDSLEKIEANIHTLSKKLDLSKCPAGCRYHPMNRLVETVLKPDEAKENHPNFL